MEYIGEIEDTKDIEDLLLNKLNDLQKKVREFLNVKLQVNLTGKEIKLDLNNKNIGNIELNLLSCLEFENLEEFNLSHNKISDIEPLKDFNFSKLKKLDLSFNNLNYKENFKNNKVDDNDNDNDKLNYPKENNKILSKNLIKLDDNNLLAKDIEEIKNQIISYNQPNNFEIDNSLFFLTGKKSNNNNKKDFIISLLNKLEKKVMNFLNVKLDLNLTGNEIKLDLNNKNIDNIELNLLSCINFKNLEDINLSHNNISNIEPLKDFNSPKLRKFDLSFNKISNISSFKEILKKNNNIEFINLSNNSITNVEILKTNIFPFVKEINLDNNNIIRKDIDEIKEILLKSNNFNNIINKMKYKIDINNLNFNHNHIHNHYHNMRYMINHSNYRYENEYNSLKQMIPDDCQQNNNNKKEKNILMMPYSFAIKQINKNNMNKMNNWNSIDKMNIYLKNKIENKNENNLLNPNDSINMYY